MNNIIQERKKPNIHNKQKTTSISFIFSKLIVVDELWSMEINVSINLPIVSWLNIVVDYMPIIINCLF
jgi:hypothetical protein